MARLTADATQHWLTPSRMAEDDLPDHVIDRDVGSTAPARHSELVEAYRRAAGWGCELTRHLSAEYGFPDPGPVALKGLNPT